MTYFRTDDGEHYLRVADRQGALDWSHADVGSALDGWRQFGAGDDLILPEERAVVAQQIAAQEVSADQLPSGLRPDSAALSPRHRTSQLNRDSRPGHAAAR